MHGEVSGEDFAEMELLSWLCEKKSVEVELAEAAGGLASQRTHQTHRFLGGKGTCVREAP